MSSSTCSSTTEQSAQALFFLQDLSDSNQSLDNQQDNYKNISTLVGQNAVVGATKSLAVNMNFNSTSNASDPVTAAAVGLGTPPTLQNLLYSNFFDGAVQIPGLLAKVYANNAANGGAFGKLFNPQGVNPNPDLPFSTAYAGNATYDLSTVAAIATGADSLVPGNYTGDANLQYNKKTFQQQVVSLIVQPGLGNCWYSELANISFKSPASDLKLVLMNGGNAVNPQPTAAQWAGTSGYTLAENDFIGIYAANAIPTDSGSGTVTATASVPTTIHKLFANNNDLLSAVGTADISLEAGDIPPGLSLAEAALLLFGSDGPDLESNADFLNLYNADCSDKNTVAAWVALSPTDNSSGNDNPTANKLAVGNQIKATYNAYQDYDVSTYPDLVSNLNSTVSDTDIYDDYVSGVDANVKMQNWIGLTNTAASNADLVQFANVNYTGTSGTNVVSGTRSYIQSNPLLLSGLTSSQAMVDMLTNNGLDQITELNSGVASIRWTNSPVFSNVCYRFGTGAADATASSVAAVAGWVNATADLVTLYSGLKSAALQPSVGSTVATASESQVENYLFSTNPANTYSAIITTTTVGYIVADTAGLIANKSIEYKTEVAMIESIASMQLDASPKIASLGANNSLFQQMLVDNSDGSAQPASTTTFSADLFPIFSQTNLVGIFLFGANCTGILSATYCSSTYNLFKGLSTISDNQKIVLFAFDIPTAPVQLICMGQTVNTNVAAAQLVIDRLVLYQGQFTNDQLLAFATVTNSTDAQGNVTTSANSSPRSNNSSGGTLQQVYVQGAAAGTVAADGSAPGATGIFGDSTNVGRLLSCLSGANVDALTVSYAKDTNSQIENLFATQNVKDAFASLMNAQTLTSDYVFDTNDQPPFNRLMAVPILQGDYELVADIMPLAPNRTGPFIAAVVSSWSAGTAFDSLKLFNGKVSTSLELDYAQTTNTVNFVNQTFTLLVAPQGVTTMAFITAAADAAGASTRQQEMMCIFNALLVNLIDSNGVTVKEVRLALTQTGYDNLQSNGGLSVFTIFECIVESFIPINGSLNQVNKVEIFVAARTSGGVFVPAVIDPTTGIINYPSAP